MRFKDAAYEILKRAGKPLHYADITDFALADGLLDTSGQTPHASMGALLYTDTLNPDSRFKRGDARGTFAIKVAAPAGIQTQIENIQRQVRQDLRKHLFKMPPRKFEELIRQLLVQMGFEETETTPYSNDKGVDVRGILRTNPCQSSPYNAPLTSSQSAPVIFGQSAPLCTVGKSNYPRGPQKNCPEETSAKKAEIHGHTRNFTAAARKPQRPPHCERPESQQAHGETLPRLGAC